MKYKILSSLLLGALVLFFIQSYGQTQKPNVSFEKTVHNFGKVKEEAGNVTTSFEFTNTGGQPVIIGNVKASCGCTSPTWSKKPILPGAKGFVKAAFDPRNRPGQFNKSITVYSNAVESPVVLRIKGVVEPRPKTLADTYPFKLEALRLKTNHAAFTKTYNDQVKTKTIDIVNISGSDIDLSFSRVPSHITVKAEPASLSAEEKGKIIVKYDARKVKDWGYVRDRFFIDINGVFDAKNRVYVSASITENFDNLSPQQLAQAPKAVYQDQRFDFGSIDKGEKIVHEFKVKNEGKSELKIRKIKASCGCTATNPDKRTIPPGDTGTIRVTFNSAHKNGRQNKAVTVITNDPKNYKQILWIKGTVN